MGAVTAELPAEGQSDAQVIAQLRAWASAENGWRAGKVSGTVYCGDDSLARLAAEATRLYALANPLHPDVFPSLRKMEAEVVAMALRLFHAPPAGCGTMSSGGTESILLACKAARDAARLARGVLAPEMVLPSTAHAAFLKAGHYLGIKVVRVPVNPGTFRADVEAMGWAVCANTVLLVGSAPSFAQGVLDPLEALADLAQRRGVPLHVDCCLGSLLLPLMDKLGYEVPPFDFRLPGVCSISVDLHTYGFAPKGSAVILYASEEASRHHQYFVAADWAGGIYATPTLCGSRPGAVVAATWAVMLRMGEAGYLGAFERILQATRTVEEGVRAIDELAIYGAVDTSVVCFGARPRGGGKAISILQLGDAMVARGWSLNTLQNPPCLHLCVCMPHTAAGVAEGFILDLRAAVEEVLAAKGRGDEGAASAVYGLAELVRENSVIEEVACTFIDALYKV
ncbi:sphingosine-1-phosphate lyase 1 [Pavlovales sp. CCMP2436]|nr:sphingosine-1-phosphate lyase 1 [Pavlovales sp. CCMP2436]